MIWLYSATAVWILSFILSLWMGYCFTSVCLRWYVTFYHSKITMKKHKFGKRLFDLSSNHPTSKSKFDLRLCHEWCFQPPGPCVFSTTWTLCLFFCHGSANQSLEDAGRCFESTPLHVFFSLARCSKGDGPRTLWEGRDTKCKPNEE